MKMIEDPKRKAEIGKLARIANVIEEIAVIGEGIMIVGAEIVIGIMTEIVAMIGSVRGIKIAPAVMIQEVAEGRAHGRWNVPGIMIATVGGAMIGTRLAQPGGMDMKVNASLSRSMLEFG